MSYRARLRVELPDRPGALARVATVIADHGGNVVGIDVHEVEHGRACDELLVDLPDDLRVATLVDALVDSGAGSLLSIRPGDGSTDPVLRSLRWACAMVAAGTAAEQELTRAIAEVCGTPAAWVLDVGQATMFEAGRLALDRGRPFVHRTEQVPARLAPGADEEWWLLAVPDGRLDPRRVAFVARPVRHRFNSTDVSRVASLLGLLRALEVGVDRSVLSPLLSTA